MGMSFSEMYGCVFKWYRWVCLFAWHRLACLFAWNWWACLQMGEIGESLNGTNWRVLEWEGFERNG